MDSKIGMLQTQVKVAHIKRDKVQQRLAELTAQASGGRLAQQAR